MSRAIFATDEACRRVLFGGVHAGISLTALVDLAAVEFVCVWRQRVYAADKRAGRL